MDKDRKKQYREELLNQIEAKKQEKLRNKGAGEEETGLKFEGVKMNPRVVSPRQLNNQILDQINEKTDNKTKKRQVLEGKKRERLKSILRRMK